MYLYADWLLWDAEEFMSATISRVIPYIDSGVIIDTGSTDATLGIAKAFAERYPEKIRVIEYGSLAPGYDISKARNVGWQAAPEGTTWHWNIADDEIYDISELVKLRKFLEEQEATTDRFVKLKFRDMGPGPQGTISWTSEIYDRPMVHRYDRAAKWTGRWGREVLKYPDGLHTWSKTEVMDPDVYYWHVNWIRRKQGQTVDIYNQMEREGR